MARVELQEIAHSYIPDPRSDADYALKHIHDIWDDGFQSNCGFHIAPGHSACSDNGPPGRFLKTHKHYAGWHPAWPRINLTLYTTR